MTVRTRHCVCTCVYVGIYLHSGTYTVCVHQITAAAAGTWCFLNYGLRGWTKCPEPALRSIVKGFWTSHTHFHPVPSYLSDIERLSSLRNHDSSVKPWKSLSDQIADVFFANGCEILPSWFNILLSKMKSPHCKFLFLLISIVVQVKISKHTWNKINLVG